MRLYKKIILAFVILGICSCEKPVVVPVESVREEEEEIVKEQYSPTPAPERVYSEQEQDETVPAEDLVPRKDISLTRTQADYVKTGGNGFAINLFKALAGDENMIISPLGVTFDLGMLDNGALGNTKAEIERVLGYSEGSADSLNTFCNTLLESVKDIDPSTKIEIANAAVINSSRLPLLEDFKKVIESNYFAEVCSMDFRTEDVKGYINHWCDEKTHGLIPKILNNPPTDAEYAHFLNAVYFNGIWSNQFLKENTRREKFTDISDKTTTVNMMSKMDYCEYGVTDLGSVVVLPFGNKAFQMILILPPENWKLDEFREALDLDSWNTFIKSPQYENVNVKIPSFEADYTEDINETLQKLGMHDAFSPKANFKAMTEEDVILSGVLHKAKIKVDEKGSVAAAVTDTYVASIANAPGDSPKIVNFHADRPFIYAITEVSTGAIFFIGQYTGIVKTEE